MDDDRSLTEVLNECVTAAGGAKVVGPKLWPEKLVDPAQRALLDCLNDDRPHRLSPDQVLLVAKMAREKGCHAFMAYCSRHLQYQPPVPREPAQELAELLRQFNASGAQQQLVLARITELMGALPPGMVGGLKAVA